MLRLDPYGFRRQGHPLRFLCCRNIINTVPMLPLACPPAKSESRLLEYFAFPAEILKRV